MLGKSGSSSATVRDDATADGATADDAITSDASETDSATPLLDRRMYLRLTGAAAASLVGAGAIGTASGAGSFERIVVPAGANRRIRVESGQTLENKLIDVTAHDATLEIVARGDGWVIRNVGFVGPTTNSLESRTKGSKMLKLAGNGLVENVYLGDGNDPDPDGAEKDMSRDGGIYLNGPNHTGHIEVRRSNIGMWADNGCYCSGPGAQHGPDGGGTVQFTDCYLENNNVSGIRLGTNGSGAENCTIVIDDESAIPGVPRKPRPQNPIKHGRGFWIREGTSVDGVLIEDCDVSCTIGGSHEAIKVNRGSGCTVRNSRIEGEIDVDGRLRRENVSGNPNLSPPAGVPMSAEEAASGGSSLPNHLVVQGTGDLAPYEFTVSGDLGAGPDFDTDGTDGISGSTGSGRVNGTGSDDFYFSGRLTRFSHGGDLEVSVDGERIDPDSFLPHELRVQGTGERTNYEFEVSGDLAPGSTFDTDGTDEISDSVGRGRVAGTGDDSFSFAGDVVRFERDGPLELYVDGEQVDPDGFTGPSRTISIVGDGPRAEYEFTVSGALEKSTARNGSINAGDEISGSSAAGYVLAGTDSYAFDGEVTDFTVDNPSAVTVYLDGEQVDPDAYRLPHEISISNGGFSEPATYEFAVSGDLQATKSINPSDEISGSNASGRVDGGTDTYRYSGSVVAFDNDGPVEVTLDGRTVKSGE